MERELRIFTEERLQQAVIGAGHTVEWLLNAYYLFAHVVVTASVFLWLYLRQPQTYVRFRRVMIVMTLAGLALHLLYPLAPPRMFPNLGFVDTGRIVGPASYGRGSAYSGFANQFAAMPSLHFGWALAVAWSVILATRSRLRGLVVLHPVLTLAAIVLTANHYWLDAIVATLLFAAALLFDRWRVRLARSTSAEDRRESAWTHGFPGITDTYVITPTQAGDSLHVAVYSRSNDALPSRAHAPRSRRRRRTPRGLATRCTAFTTITSKSVKNATFGRRPSASKKRVCDSSKYVSQWALNTTPCASTSA